jgi:isopentenyl diphosphate isomerase/L-lactate dehydrogenase-like FMN-dependent dehydrogenase
MAKPINVADYCDKAQRRLPRFVWDSIEGGAGDEITLRRNRTAFSDYVLRPRPLVDVSRRDQTTTVLGTTISLPVILGPVGAGRLVHHDAERIAARAAADAGTIYCLSSVARAPEELAGTANGPMWFQLYIRSAREHTERLVRRALAANYKVLCVTVDGAVSGIRERDIRNYMKPPVEPRARFLIQGAAHPAWAANFVDARRLLALRGANGPAQTSLRDVEDEITSVFHPVTWDDLAWLRDLWPGPLIVKGIMRGEECARLIGLGVDGIVVSNHGGRQLDGVSATIEALPEVAAAVGGKVEVYLDGGIRRGSDVVKALALGAKAVLIGRPYIYGLAVRGQHGAEDVLRILRHETDNTMALLGCSSVANIDSSLVRRTGDTATARAAYPWEARPGANGAHPGHAVSLISPSKR